MTHKTSQINRRGSSAWLVRIYFGRDPETGRLKYICKSIYGGLRFAQAQLNRMLAEQDFGRNIRSSRRTPSQHLDHLLDICASSRCVVVARRQARITVRNMCSTKWRNGTESLESTRPSMFPTSCARFKSRQQQRPSKSLSYNYLRPTPTILTGCGDI